MPNNYYVYILASKRNGTLYIGVTNDLARRLWEHREGLVPGFTKRYGVKTLVYFETFDDVDRRDPPRKAAEEVQARLEDQSHPAAQCRVARPDRDVVRVGAPLSGHRTHSPQRVIPRDCGGPR